MRNYSDRSRCHTGIYRRLHYDLPSVVIGNYRKNMLMMMMDFGRHEERLTPKAAAEHLWEEFLQQAGITSD